MTGKIINNYVIERKLGDGGMGAVYYARHNRIDREVAIKILHSNLFTNESIRTRFKNEANALIKLSHPNIVKIFDYVEQDNLACLIMEYISGTTLDDYIARITGPLPEQKSIPIICAVLDAVQYAHDCNIYHRDIKPGNIMIAKDGQTVKIMDFGIAKLNDTGDLKITNANAQLGTPFYMSPEQVKGLPFTKLSDIYSLGVTLFEMVTGKCPYQSITNLFELQSKIVNEPLPATANYYPDVSVKLQAAIKKATEKNPVKRFTSCTEFKNFLLAETNTPIEAPVKEVAKRNIKSQPAQQIRTVGENKIETIKPPDIKQALATVNKISHPNLLESYPGNERKSKLWILLLAIAVVLIFAAFFLMENKKDRDGDGIVDVKDKCPDVIGLAINNGCPAYGDSDGDGVPDSTDSCPGIFGLGSLKGCPDRDNDGIADKEDSCKDLSGPISLQGCPDTSVAQSSTPPTPIIGTELKTGDITKKPQEKDFKFLTLSQIKNEAKIKSLNGPNDLQYTGKGDPILVADVNTPKGIVLSEEEQLNMPQLEIMSIPITIKNKLTEVDEKKYQFRYKKIGKSFELIEVLNYN